MKPKVFLLCAVVFAFCCWCIQLGGLAALEHSCNHVPSNIANYAKSQNVTHIASVFQSVVSFNDEYNYGTAPRCSILFGLQWWITSAFLFILIGITFCAFSEHAHVTTGSAWGMTLAVVSAILWMLCQRYSVVNWNLDNAHTPLWEALGSLKTPLEVTYAGYILEAISAIFLLFGLNAMHYKPTTAAWAPPMSTRDPTLPEDSHPKVTMV